MKSKFSFVRLPVKFFSFCTVLVIVLILPLEIYALKGEEPKSWSESMLPLTSVSELVLPMVEPEKMMKRQEESKKPYPLVFAVPHEVSITPDTYGSWENIESGQIWRVRVYCPKGSDINLGFSRYKMPGRGSLHLYSECEEYYQGPYTEKHNKKHKNLWLPVVPCARAVVEVFLPHYVDKKELELELTRVNCGFLDIFKRRTRENSVEQGDCNTRCYLS